MFGRKSRKGTRDERATAGAPPALIIRAFNFKGVWSVSCPFGDACPDALGDVAKIGMNLPFTTEGGNKDVAVEAMNEHLDVRHGVARSEARTIR